MKKILRYPFFLIFLLLLIPIIVWELSFRIEWVGLSVAWLVGIGAIMQSQIIRWFFPPLFKIRVKEVSTATTGGEPQKWYNLSIKNYGFSSAKNVRVKIRDEENKSWINLRRPFADLLEEKDRTVIKNLSINEEDDFNIGHSERRNYFKLETNIIPTNQRITLDKIGEQQTYYLEIIADNVKPYSFKLQITNKEYQDFNTSNIQII